MHNRACTTTWWRYPGGMVFAGPTATSCGYLGDHVWSRRLARTAAEVAGAGGSFVGAGLLTISCAAGVPAAEAVPAVSRVLVVVRDQTADDERCQRQAGQGRGGDDPGPAGRCRRCHGSPVVTSWRPAWRTGSSTNRHDRAARMMVTVTWTLARGRSKRPSSRRSGQHDDRVVPEIDPVGTDPEPAHGPHAKDPPQQAAGIDASHDDQGGGDGQGHHAAAVRERRVLVGPPDQPADRRPTRPAR